MAEHRQKTVNRDDDGRLHRGRRLIFGANDTEALLCARVMLRLKPEYQRVVRTLAEELADGQLTQTAAALKAEEARRLTLVKGGR